MTQTTAYCRQPVQSARIECWVQHIPWLLPIIAVYFCLAFYRIGYQSLWLDEVLSANAANPEKSFYEVGIWRLGSRPLYFSLLHLWAQFGSSEVALRSLSAVIGGVGVVLIYLLGLRLFNPRAAWIATVLFATSPFFIWYSQEVRYITFLITSSLFGMYAYHRALSVARVGDWASYCFSLTIAIGAFLTNVLLIVIQGLYLVLSRGGRKSFRAVIICQLCVFLLFVWWANEWRYQNLAGYWNRFFHELTLENEELKSIPKKERFSRGGRRAFDLAAIPYTFFTFSVGFSLGPSVAELQMDRSLGALSRHAPAISIVTLLFGGLFLLGLIGVRRQRDNAMLLGLWLGVPLIAACTVSALTNASFNVRYVAMVLPAYLFILTAGILIFRARLCQNAVLGCILAVNLFSLSNYYFDPRYARADSRSASQYLDEVAGPGDTIVVVGSTPALQYYYKGSPPIVGWSVNPSDGSAVTERLNEIRNDHDYLWLVQTRRWQRDPAGNVKKAADKLYSLVRYRGFAGVDIYLYDLRCGSAGDRPGYNGSSSCAAAASQSPKLNNGSGDW
jgi:4-amino-4-deoxy-L-arabinose transferase-like glycosyltransferase